MEFVNRRLVAEAGEAHRLGCREERGLMEHVTALRLEILYTRAASTPCMAGLRVQGSAVMSAGREQLSQLLEKVFTVWGRQVSLLQNKLDLLHPIL